MAIEILPVATSVVDGWLTAGEAVPPGAFLVLRGLRRQVLPGLGLAIGDSAENSYGTAWSLAVSFGMPMTWIALGRVHLPLPEGGRFLLDGSYPELAQVFRITGADSWILDGSAAQAQDATGTVPHNTAWSLPDLSTQHERVLIGVLGCGRTAFGAPTLTGGYPSGITQELFVPALGPNPDEYWSCMQFQAVADSSVPTAHSASGEFSTAQEFWAGAHLALRPVFRGVGNRVSAARGVDGRLLVADATSGLLSLRRYGDSIPENEIGSGSGVAGGNACSLQAHRDGRWSLVTVGQDSTTHPEGGYGVLLHESRDQGRTWTVSELYSWEEPLTAHVGYQAALHALDRRTGLMLLMLYSHRESAWKSCVGHRNAAGTAWSFTTPEMRVAGALSRADLQALPEGRFRFAYVTEGDLLQLVTAPVSGFGTINEESLGTERAVQYVTLSGLNAAGEGEWSAPVTVATAAPPTAEDAFTVVPTYDAVYLTRDRLGRLLVAAHETVWKVSSITVPAVADQQTYLFAGTPDTDGTGWSFAPRVAMTAAQSGRDGCLRSRSDGTLEWIYRASGGALTRRQCRALSGDGVGTWS